MELKFVIVSVLFLLWARYLISAANQQTCHVTMICDNGPAWINFTAWNQEQLEKSLHEMYSNIIKEMEADVVTITRRLERIQNMRADRLISNQTTAGIPSTSNTGITRKQDRTSTTDIFPTAPYWGYEDTTNPYTPGLTTDFTTTSTMDTFGTEVPSSTTVLSTPTMTGTTQSQEATPPSVTVVSLPTESEPPDQPGTNPSSTAIFSSSSQTSTTKMPETTTQGGRMYVNVTADYGIPSCPPYCNSTNKTSYINHEWCVRQNRCNCNGSILELKKNTIDTEHICMRPLQKDCPSTCDFFAQNPQFYNSSTVISQISGYGLHVICECDNRSGSGLPSTYGWVIIQRLLRNDTTDFNVWPTLVDYENRFWNPHFWHGLKYIYQLTSDNASLQIEFEKIDSTGAKKYFFVRYSHFSIGDNSTNYRLNVIEQPHCGSDTKRLPDYLDPKSVHPVFTVKDDSGWWFYDSNGLGFNLNAKWNNGIRWGNETYDTVVMKIRPGGAEKVLCVDVTKRFLISECPKSCSSTDSAEHKWCVRDSCTCDDLHVRWKDNTHACCKAEDCVVPVADNCTQICERALADGSKLIPGQHNKFSPDGTFAARIIDGGPKQVQCNCMNGTRTGMLETNGWVIIQRRLNADANFSRTLSDYQRGFKDRQNFWIGLRSLYGMTKTRSNGAFLQIELGKSENGTMMFYNIRYRRFYVSSQARNFSLAVEFDSMKASTAHDALDSENEIPIFSMNGSSGWWFTGDPTNLNGKSGILWGNMTYDIAQMLILPQYDEADNCTYAYCSRISTTNQTFCIGENCKCDRSWLLLLMPDGIYRPDWTKACKVPIGDNCSEICQILSDMKKLNYPTETVAYKKINGDTYVKVYCKCTEENTGQLVIWRNGNGSFPASLYDNGRIGNDESSGKDEKCFYGDCSTSITFCINDKCLCDWSWLAVEQTGTTRGWNICTVPVGDNCVDACRIWSRLKIATSPNRRIAYIKIYGKYEKVYCDCSDNDPGWLVIWEKGDGALLQKSKFEHGFNENGSYWIGFKFIGRLTDQYNASLLMTVRKRSTSEQGKTRLIKYQSFFKNGKNFIGEQPSVVNSSEQETPYLHNFEMDRSSTEWCFEDDTSCAKFGWPISRDLYRYDVMEMKIMTGKVLCPVEYEGKCFLPFTEFTVKCADGTEFCKSIGGHLANIYSQTHMDDVAKFVRSHRMRNNDRMYFQLGMKSENRTIYFHNGTETSMQWLLAGDNNIVAFRVTKELSAGLYIPHNQCKDLYPLCEIEKT